MMTMGQTGFPKAEMDAALARLRRAYERMDAEIERAAGRGCWARISPLPTWR